MTGWWSGKGGKGTETSFTHEKEQGRVWELSKQRVQSCGLWSSRNKQWVQSQLERAAGERGEPEGTLCEESLALEPLRLEGRAPRAWSRRRTGWPDSRGVPGCSAENRLAPYTRWDVLGSRVRRCGPDAGITDTPDAGSKSERGLDGPKVWGLSR